MTTISLNNDVVTTINTFTVEPQHQQRALELLAERKPGTALRSCLAFSQPIFTRAQMAPA
ncbi:MAG TPA: hypothetical protein VHZ51_17450 [Ktedonobacteraceae bacterium]|jgi:hypothetical protein|nr:hypothetical protein [Ktedonobacteraceae bacterium]